MKAIRQVYQEHIFVSGGWEAKRCNTEHLPRKLSDIFGTFFCGWQRGDHELRVQVVLFI